MILTCQGDNCMPGDNTRMYSFVINDEANQLIIGNCQFNACQWQTDYHDN